MSQGQSITQITASVGTAQTTADSAKSSAAAAQQAATNAATAAGNKGKVIYGTAEPAVADRLTQNVWIDTTNSANTPKRWNGSAWQAVTDKAATDAAAAAKSAASAGAAAHSTANGAVQSVNAVSATVTQQGNTITAQGAQISQLTATVNGATTKISDISQVVNGIDGKLSASRTIKVGVDANGKQYLAGICLDVSNSTTGMQSNIILLADRTSIMTNAGGTPTPVFTTQGTQAILNSVVIGDATITSAKIKDAAITGAKIANTQIGTAHIVDGAITNAKIAGIVQSNNYSAINRTGWMINKNGDADFFGRVYAGKMEGDITAELLNLSLSFSGQSGMVLHAFALFTIEKEVFIIGSPEPEDPYWSPISGNPSGWRMKGFCLGIYPGLINQVSGSGFYVDDDFQVNRCVPGGGLVNEVHLSPRETQGQTTILAQSVNLVPTVKLIVPAGTGKAIIKFKFGHRNSRYAGFMRFDVRAYKRTDSIAKVMTQTPDENPR
ncbi:MAG: DUF1983 domain-containing protein [Symbiopectobacterium sp.]|uniref:phage tail tip fiber protein n=1 Tax=Symbiopectobacterium sp. TaxID=2952789 RepID=UPI0039EC59D3